MFAVLLGYGIELFVTVHACCLMSDASSLVLRSSPCSCSARFEAIDCGCRGGDRGPGQNDPIDAFQSSLQTGHQLEVIKMEMHRISESE
jgi:hypothetical protein